MIMAVLGAAALGRGMPPARAAEPAASPKPTDPPRVPLDPLARTVVESLRHPAPETPREWLVAAIAAADVDAVADAVDFYRRFLDAVAAAQGDQAALLADLGDVADPAGVRRLERTLRPYEPDAPKLLGSLGAAASQRRRDPQRLDTAVAGLRSESRGQRIAAADHLAACGTDALPALVALLQTDDAAGDHARALAIGLVRQMGEDGRAALLAWLGSDDIDHWPGVITALAAYGDDDVEFLLAPALAADAPPAVGMAAQRALTARGIAPTPDTARMLIARRLDRTLSPAGIPTADSLDDKTLEWFTWDARGGAPRRVSFPSRLARAERAVHLARDLAALGPTDPAHIRLVLLARLEMTAALAAEDPANVGGMPPDDAVLAALSGPDGFDPAMVGDVLDEAAARGMKTAATAAARVMRIAHQKATEEDAKPTAPLLPAVRGALVRALAAPDAGLAFEAAVTLATCGGEPPYRGASQVVKTLLHAATSTGIDRAIVAHPEVVIVEELANGLSRHGYETIRVRSGRDAILAARDSADTVLVVLAARLARPSALETVQLIQLGSQLESPPVLVVVDPLDDDPRGKFLSRLIMSFAEIECVAIVDRLESFFQPAIDPGIDGEPRPPRFHDALAIAAGPQAGDPARRAARAATRLARARTALDTLASLGERGWDVAAAVPLARAALSHPDLHDAAVAVLAAVGDPAAQQSLFREAGHRDLPDAQRAPARAAFAASVRRYGLLLERGDILRASAMYNRATDAESRRTAGALLEILESPRIRPTTAQLDAPEPRPTRR